MNKNRIYWIIGGLIILTIIIYLLSFNKAHASVTLPVCNADHKFNCIQPTNTPTPTFNPCKKIDGMQWEDDYEPCPTPTKEPTITPTVSVSPTPPVASPSAIPAPSNNGGGGSDGGNQPPPVASCGTPFDIPVIVRFTDKGNGTVNFAWVENQTVDKYSITYGYSPDNLNMGEDNIAGSSANIDIHDLRVGSHVWAQVQGWFRGCEESSNVFDPLIK